MIYILYDNRKGFKELYVGKTNNSGRRLMQHSKDYHEQVRNKTTLIGSCCSHYGKKRWFKKLSRENQRFTMLVIDPEETHEEFSWIAYFNNLNCIPVNSIQDRIYAHNNYQDSIDIYNFIDKDSEFFKSYDLFEDNIVYADNIEEFAHTPEYYIREGGRADKRVSSTFSIPQQTYFNASLAKVNAHLKEYNQTRLMFLGSNPDRSEIKMKFYKDLFNTSQPVCDALCRDLFGTTNKGIILAEAVKNNQAYKTDKEYRLAQENMKRFSNEADCLSALEKKSLLEALRQPVKTLNWKKKRRKRRRNKWNNYKAKGSALALA